MLFPGSQEKAEESAAPHRYFGLSLWVSPSLNTGSSAPVFKETGEIQAALVPAPAPISPAFLIFKNYLYKILNIYDKGKALEVKPAPFNSSLTLRDRTVPGAFEALWAPPQTNLPQEDTIIPILYILLFFVFGSLYTVVSINRLLFTLFLNFM